MVEQATDTPQPSLLEALRRMGEDVEREWNASRNRRQFSAVAFEVLREAQLPALAWPELLAYCLEHGNHSSFGDLQATAYLGADWVVELLVWGSGSPDIHSHAFGGAFRVVEGGSVHASYSLIETQWSSPHLIVGKVQLDELRLLRRGDTHLIEAGPAFIHGLYHWQRPSATVVVRLKREPAHPHQFGMENATAGTVALAAGRELALDPVVRALLAHLELCPPHLLEPWLMSSLAAIGPARLWYVLETAGNRLPGRVKLAIAEHLPDALRSVLSSGSAPSVLRSMRRKLTSDRARIGAGLALFAPDLSTALECIRDAELDEDPLRYLVAACGACFADLLQEDAAFTTPVVRAVLEGRAHSELFAELVAAYDEGSVRENRDAILAARETVGGVLAALADPDKRRFEP